MDKSTIYFCTHLYILVVAALVVNNPPADAGDARDASLIPSWEDPLEKGMATHSSILA